MLRKVAKAILRIPRQYFATEFVESLDIDRDRVRQSLIRMCSMLGTKYLDLNEDIHSTSSIRVIDEQTNNFLGIMSVEKALLTNKRVGTPGGKRPGALQRQI